MCQIFSSSGWKHPWEALLHESWLTTPPLCRHSQVIVGRSPLVLATSPGFGRGCHGHQDVYAATTRHHNGCHLWRYHDCIYESHKLGAQPYGRGLPHSHPGGCHRVGVRRLSAVAVISTQCHQYWCPISPTMADVHPTLCKTVLLRHSCPVSTVNMLRVINCSVKCCFISNISSSIVPIVLYYSQFLLFCLRWCNCHPLFSLVKF